MWPKNAKASAGRTLGWLSGRHPRYCARGHPEIVRGESRREWLNQPHDDGLRRSDRSGYMPSRSWAHMRRGFSASRFCRASGPTPDRVDGHQCGGGGRRAGSRRRRPLLVARRRVGAQDGLARGHPAHGGAERRVHVGDPCVFPHRSRQCGGEESVDRTLLCSRRRTAADSNAGHTSLAKSACVVGCPATRRA